MIKKLLVVAVVAGGAYLVYRQVMNSRAEEDLWTEATNAPDLGLVPEDAAAEAVAETTAQDSDES